MRKEMSFSSCKVLCQHFRIGKATCLRILHDKLGLKKNLFSPGTVCPIDQPEERKSSVFEATSGGPDGTENEPRSTDYDRG
jgi:hypothetical protein